MYKLCLLLVAASAINMDPVPAPSSSTVLPPCVEDETKSTCHFEGTKNICACPNPFAKKQIIVGECVPKTGPTGSKACYVKETLDKEFKQECPCPAAPEKKLVQENRNPAVSLGMPRF